MSDMHHDDRDLDAAEYVLGTLSPEAARDMAERMARAVSYTHLTLPTICSV